MSNQQLKRTADAPAPGAYRGKFVFASVQMRFVVPCDPVHTSGVYRGLLLAGQARWAVPNIERAASSMVAQQSEPGATPFREPEFVSGADLALEEFVLTKRDEAALLHALDNGLARPKFSLPPGRVVFE